MKEARLWIWRRTMQSAAPDTSRQKKKPFPHSPIQLLSACLSTEYIIIHSSVQECFKDATLSLIRNYRMHTFMPLLERDNPREAAGFWRRNCISIKSNNGTKLIKSVTSKQCWPTCCCHYHYGPLMLNNCNRMHDKKISICLVKHKLPPPPHGEQQVHLLKYCEVLFYSTSTRVTLQIKILQHVLKYFYFNTLCAIFSINTSVLLLVTEYFFFLESSVAALLK